MEINFAAVLCIAAFVISVLLSYIRKINTGITAMGFAYLIGCFFMDLEVGTVVSMFPIKILFLLFSVCLFYGYAIQNGTLQKIADHVIYYFRGQTKLLPFILYLLAFFMALLGAGAPAVSSFMAPVCIAIGASTGIHYLIMLVLICQGSSAGSWVPWGQGGLILRGLIEESAYGSDASEIAVQVCFNHFLTGLCCLGAVYVFLGGYKASAYEAKKPEKFNPVQKKTLIILAAVILLALIPSIGGVLQPQAGIKKFSELFDIQMLSIIGAVVCGVLKLGNEKDIIKNQVPWNTILMVGGICMLLNVTVETGIFQKTSELLTRYTESVFMGVILVLIGGIMSFFTGALTVVTPMFLPMVLAAAAVQSLKPEGLVSALVIGATVTACSPVSTGGSFILSCIPDNKVREKMFQRQFLMTCLLLFVPLLLSAAGVYSIL